MSVMHVHGFVHDGRPSGVKVSVVEGTVADVANGVIKHIREVEGHTTTTETIRSLDGWLREVHAYTSVNGTELWHVFTEPSEAWEMS